MRAWLLTALLAAPLGALSPDREARKGAVERELPLIIYKGRDLKRPAMAPQMKVALVKASGPTRRLVGLFARKKAERCGVCPARVDEEGVHCNRRDGVWNNCGQGCAGEMLLISAEELAKAGFRAESGALYSGRTLMVGEADRWGLKTLIHYGAAKNGFSRDQFVVGPVAMCRH